MTLTKMIKVLKYLSERFGADFEVFHLIDYWGDEKMREVVTIGHLIGWFETKADNMFFNTYSVVNTFKRLEKHIERQNKPIEVSYFYQDSYDTYMAAWQERHPNENYKDWYIKRVNTKSIKWLTTVNHFLKYLLPEVNNVYYDKCLSN